VVTKTGRRALHQAVHLLMHGYEEEINLYSLVRDLSRRQEATLGTRDGIRRFCELHRRKEEALELIGRIESEMGAAKSIILAHPPEACPHRRRLGEILENVQRTIRAVREAEERNAAMLERVPA